ncbi:MAG: hypothetical protein V1814_03030 [Candidatus Moraniibacteriota bacterium]
MNKKIQKIFSTLLLFAFLSLAFTPSARADTWGANMMAAIWKQTTEQMVKSIQDTLLANLKMAALRIIQSRLMSLLGSSGNSMVPGVTNFIISDWKMFIYGSASKYSTQVTNDFFRNLQAGSTGAINQYVISPAQRAVNVNYWSMRPDLQNYVAGGDASKIFNTGAASNPWMAWRMAAMPQNDLAFTYLRAESYKQAAYNQEAQARMSEGQAGQGYKSKEATTSSGAKVTVPSGSDYKGQNITTAGSDIKELANEVTIRMKTQMLSLARSIPEVVTAMVNQMLTQVIQQGVTSMTSSGGSGSSFNMSSMTSQMTGQAQSLIQSGVRSAASPNMFFGR